MFGLFSKKEKPFPVTDLVWVSTAGKLAGLLQLVKEKPKALFATWFEETGAEAEIFLKSQNHHVDIHSFRQLHSAYATGNEVIFLEHCPLYKKEQDLFRSLAAVNITVLNSLDEPLLKHFGGERIAAIMKAMGAGEEEAISHAMISNSIVKAQQKLDKEVELELNATSSAEWFRKNRKV